MKKIIAALLLCGLLAAPGFAKTRKHHRRKHHRSHTASKSHQSQPKTN